MLAGTPRDDSAVAAAVERFLAWPPSIDRRDCLYWYFSTLVVQRADGRRWGQWRRSLHGTISRTQVLEEGTDFGSWDPLKPSKDVHAAVGGATHCDVYEPSCGVGRVSHSIAAPSRSAVTRLVPRRVRSKRRRSLLAAIRSRSGKPIAPDGPARRTLGANRRPHYQSPRSAALMTSARRRGIMRPP